MLWLVEQGAPSLLNSYIFTVVYFAVMLHWLNSHTVLVITCHTVKWENKQYEETAEKVAIAAMLPCSDTEGQIPGSEPEITSWKCIEAFVHCWCSHHSHSHVGGKQATFNICHCLFRWRTKQWQLCSISFTNRFHLRLVYCKVLWCVCSDPVQVLWVSLLLGQVDLLQTDTDSLSDCGKV